MNGPEPLPEPARSDPFAAPARPDARGVVAWGVALTADHLLAAYRRGIFPWPTGERGPVPWVCPDPRAILPFALLHLPRSLRRSLRRSGFTCTIDRDFAGVITACAAQPRPGQAGTWITRAVRRAYTDLHRLGHAHSVEVWRDGVLVGGLYGVDSGGVFSGESMFHHVDDASKAGLLHLIDHLGARGLAWLDIQQLTPHLARLGAIEVPRAVFLRLLRDGRSRARDLFPRAPAPVQPGPIPDVPGATEG